MNTSMETDEAVFRTLREFADAYSKRDLEKILKTYAPDPDVVCIGTGTNQICVGSAEVKAEFEREFARPEMLRIIPNWGKITVKGHIAWVTTNCMAEFSNNGQDETFIGCFTAILERRGQKWLFVHSHFSCQMECQA